MAQSIRDKFLAFDPNSSDQLPWATFAAGRNLQFKTHSARATALNSMNYNQLCVLYKHENGRWVELTRKDRETEDGRCKHCFGSTRESAQSYGRYLLHGHARMPDGRIETGGYVWKRGSSRRIIDPPELLFVCQACAKLLR